MIRLLIVDDEPVVRTGFAAMLEPADDIEVVAEAADGVEAVEAVRAHRPDVVLMDIRMPMRDGIAATREITALPAAPKVLVLTTFTLDEYVDHALLAGASGFLLKDASPAELGAAVRRVAQGQATLDPAVTGQVIDALRGSRPLATAKTELAKLERLTPRERQVLAHLAEGLSNAEIAAAMDTTEGTVKTYMTKLLGKLGLNRVQAAILAHDAGLTP
ncbi:response regulator [Streptomyces monticola]|uniref:Response regulator n=1 Tax=Streptomyces monticola TaxID=2666263 RepID=A0ABW2JSJ5_9ACTN